MMLIGIARLTTRAPCANQKPAPAARRSVRAKNQGLTASAATAVTAISGAKSRVRGPRCRNIISTMTVSAPPRMMFSLTRPTAE